MEDATGRALLAIGLGTAGALALWWLWGGQKGNKEEVPDPAVFQRRIANVAKLYVYPVKSCHRIELPTAHCGIRGLKYDRCWAVMDKEGRVVTQRQRPRLAQITPRLEVLEDKEEVVLYLTAPGMPELVVKEPPSSTLTKTISIWDMPGEGVNIGSEAGSWLDQFLGNEGHLLYYMAPQHKSRLLLDAPKWNVHYKKEQQISFADACPLLVLSKASLEMFNSRLDNPLRIERFRPNIIVTGCKPHEEDQWEEIKVGDSVILRRVMPCSRCKETTVDQEKGEFAGPEPLETLRKYRLYEMVHKKKDSKYGKSPLFGSYFSILQAGPINVGDTVNSK